MDNPAQMTDMEVRERVIKLEAIIRGRDELINNAVSSRIAELEKERNEIDLLVEIIISDLRAHLKIRGE